MRQRAILIVFLASTLGYPSLAGAQSERTAASIRRTSPAERAALLALYQATDGAHWKNHEGWLGPEGTECTWYGVMCSYYLNAPQLSAPRIANIELSDNNLVGAIPEAVSQLPYLESLFIAQNHLSGKIPSKLVERWLSGRLWISAEPSLLTDVSEIDFESDPSALLCGRERIIFTSDGKAILYTKRCRNATPEDRTTFCEVKEGQVYSAFAMLAAAIEKNGFFDLLPEYSRNVTDSTFDSIRVTREGGRSYEVVEDAGGGPFELWVIENAIDGLAFSTDWMNTRTIPRCPRWRQGEAP